MAAWNRITWQEVFPGRHHNFTGKMNTSAVADQSIATLGRSFGMKGVGFENTGKPVAHDEGLTACWASQQNQERI